MRWLRERAHRRLLATPFPAAWRELLQREAPFYRALDLPEQRRLEDLLRIFIADKTFVGAGGLEITDEVKVLIAASAVRLVLHLDIDRFERLQEIVVYPSAYQRPKEESVLLGEAHHWGVVVLAWDSVREGLRRPHDGHDTTLHEMAHVLDRASGSFDGTPALRARADIRPWALVMSEHYLRLRANRAPENQLIDGYGATNEAEFFAVVTEAFFEQPERLKQQLPDLYRELAKFYGRDDA